jgi:hypothetical protein
VCASSARAHARSPLFHLILLISCARRLTLQMCLKPSRKENFFCYVDVLTFFLLPGAVGQMNVCVRVCVPFSSGLECEAARISSRHLLQLPFFLSNYIILI